MHCKVDGKLFAAAIDLQNIDINFAFKAGLPGLTLDSVSTCSTPTVPTFSINNVKILQNRQKETNNIKGKLAIGEKA